MLESKFRGGLIDCFVPETVIRSYQVGIAPATNETLTLRPVAHAPCLYIHIKSLLRSYWDSLVTSIMAALVLLREEANSVANV